MTPNPALNRTPYGTPQGAGWLAGLTLPYSKEIARDEHSDDYQHA
jgi:hypothetical protein